MDKLTHLILHAIEQKRWKGIKAGRSGPMVSHLMFADDLLLFGEASEEQMCCVMATLQTFCNMSGQEISQDKTSVLFSKNVTRGLRNKILSISGFKETNCFGKYLGVPLIGKAPKRADYQYLLDQVSNKLASWKAKQLSFAGRVTLAKSVIEAVPIYPMMSSKIPKSCVEDIQKMQRHFIWGDTEEKKRFHAIGWDKLTVPKWKGGLGLRKLHEMNKACLLKLGWKYQQDSDEYWCCVLKGKYGGRNSASNETRVTDSALWKNLTELNPILEKFSYWCVGDGRLIDAWSEAWIEEGLHIDQHVVIPQHLRGLKLCDLVNNEGEWNWELISTWVPDGIQQKIAASLPPKIDYGSDERVGVGGNKSSFSVATMYNNICGFQHVDNRSMWSLIWKLKVPERVRMFVWWMHHERILTNFHKSRMGLG
jgi:hypothetical protein